MTLLGLEIAGYTIKEVLGTGGTATVYRAVRDALPSEVAIKVIMPDIARSIVNSRQFENTAQAVATLDHPHIVHVFDIGRSNAGHLYVVMALMIGGPLSRRIVPPLSRLPLPEVLQIVSDVASALDYAHARGVIHRDVKPGNILLDDRGRAFLGDFGVASFLDDRRNGKPALPFGTFAYLAPEAAFGAKPDPAADIYALGITAYELLTGKRPFEITDLDSFKAVYHDQVQPDPDHWPETLGSGLRMAVLQALHPDPAARPPHATSLVQTMSSAVARHSGGKTAEYYGLITHEEIDPPTGPTLPPYSLPVEPADEELEAIPPLPWESQPLDSRRDSAQRPAHPAPRRMPQQHPLPAWAILLFSGIGFLLLVVLAIVIAP